MQTLLTGRNIYMSPILFQTLKKHSLTIKDNIWKSDVFSFGLCQLEAGLMRQIQSIYDERKGIINEDLLEEFIDEFCKRYSDNPLQGTTVKKMLDTNESDRPDFVSIMKAIPGKHHSFKLSILVLMLVKLF